MKDCDLLIRGASEVASPAPTRAPNARFPEGALAGEGQGAFLRREGWAVAIRGPRVAAVGPEDELVPRWRPARVLDAAGGAVTPALVDPHTHLAFGGWRREDFRRRVLGERAPRASGPGLSGGIALTVAATGSHTEADLAEIVRARLDDWLAGGVTLLEAKSGYALTVDGERTLLRAQARAARGHPVELVGTVLAAHALPEAYRDRAEAYLREVALPVTAAARREGSAEYADVFVERGAFAPAEAGPYLERARDLGLGLRVHAEQLGRYGGAELAARLGAASADHLEHATEDDARALAAAGTVAVLLPAAILTLEGRGAVRPPVRALLAHGVPIAVASDCNPGTATQTAPALTLGLACRLLGLSPEEAWVGATANAAASLGRGADRGRIEPGAIADLCVWTVPQATDVAYRLDAHRPRHVLRAGRVVIEDGRRRAPEPEPGGEVEPGESIDLRRT